MLNFISEMMRALGGRKFLLAIGCLGSGIYIEVTKQAGVSPAFVGMALGILGAFSVTNAMASKDYLASKDQIPTSKVTEDINNLKSAVIPLAESVNKMHSFIHGLANSGGPNGSNSNNNRPVPGR
jgi:hypothetical protein